MAHDILYVNSQSELQPYVFDFADDLPDDTALADIGSGSTITAFSKFEYSLYLLIYSKLKASQSII